MTARTHSATRQPVDAGGRDRPADRPLLRADLPHAPRGARIGLLGGSFDPPHQGHVHISRQSLIRFGLDQIWWLVSPGNPLKAHQPAPLARRMAAAHAVLRHPRIIATNIEARIGVVNTIDTLRALRRLYPDRRFVWLMGADNLAGFHRWKGWQDIARMVPIGVLARPGSRLAARTAPAARWLRRYWLDERAAHRLADHPAPRLAFVNIAMSHHSSSAIRRDGSW